MQNLLQLYISYFVSDNYLNLGEFGLLFVVEGDLKSNCFREEVIELLLYTGFYSEL
jgi:hypothetical protein